MSRIQFFVAAVIAIQAATFSSYSNAQGGSGGPLGKACGQEPSVPAIVDGSSASMEDLVANSKEVNAFIDQADEYLDCQEVFDGGNGKLSERALEKRAELLETRNEIGDNFNAQVAAFQKANP